MVSSGSVSSSVLPARASATSSCFTFGFGADRGRLKRITCFGGLAINCHVISFPLGASLVFLYVHRLH
jgi:hypothetical protein